MTRKQTSSSRRESSTAKVVSSERQTVSQTVVTTEEEKSETVRKNDSSPIYVYKEDRWELSPKTDYTYSRTVTYSPLYMNSKYIVPNMSRRRLRSRCSEVGGDLLTSVSQTVTDTSSWSHSYAGAGNEKVDLTDTGMTMLSTQQTRRSGTSSMRGRSNRANAVQHKIPHMYGLDESDDDMMSAGPWRQHQHLHTRISLWRRIVSAFTLVARGLWLVLTKPVQLVVSVLVHIIRTVCLFMSTCRSVVVRRVQRVWTAISSAWTRRHVATQQPAVVDDVRAVGVRRQTVESDHSSNVHTSVTRTATMMSVSRWQKFVAVVWTAVAFCLVTVPSGVAYAVWKLATIPSTVGEAVVHWSWTTIRQYCVSLVRQSSTIDNHILTTTAMGNRNPRSRCCILLLLLLLLPIFFVGAYYMLLCGTGVSTNSIGTMSKYLAGFYPLTPSSRHDAVPIAPMSDTVEKPPASSLVTDGGAGVHVDGGGDGMIATACKCQDQLGVEQVQQMIDDKLIAAMAHNAESLDGKLSTLNNNMQQWTQQLLTAQLTDQRQTADAQAAAARTADDGRHRDLTSQYQSLVSRLDDLNSKLGQLEVQVTANAADRASLSSSEERSSEKQTAVVAALKSDYDRLHADVDELRAQLQHTATCCQTKQQLDTQIRSTISGYLLDLGRRDADAETKDADDSVRSSLLAWLGFDTQYVGRDELNDRLAGLAKSIADDMNKRIDSATESAAAAAVAAAMTEADKLKAAADGGGAGQPSSDGTVLAGVGVIDSHDAPRNCTLCAGAVSPEDVLRIIHNELYIYDADKTGKVDFALESAGGSVISTRCSQTFQPRTAQLSLFGVPLWYSTNSPRVAIQPGVQPGECWAFNGNEGYLVVQLSHAIVVSEVSIEHIPQSLSPTGDLQSAPRDFTVWGLQAEDDVDGVLFGNFTYITSGPPLQSFAIQNSAVFSFVELRIHSNHGHPLFTCLYRFRVHGHVPRH